MPKKQQSMRLAIRKLKIKNFKSFDDFEIEFPKPRIEHDPDVFVMGSKNGIGKTSVLESCALLFLFSTLGDQEYDSGRFPDTRVEYTEIFVRSGKETSEIEGEFEVGEKKNQAKLIIKKSNRFKVEQELKLPHGKLGFRHKYPYRDIEYFLSSLAGMNSESLFFNRSCIFIVIGKLKKGILNWG